MSFLAAVFAIDTEYPRTTADKIPFDYLMTHICESISGTYAQHSVTEMESDVVSIGLAISLPLIFIAFNVDRIVQWQAMAREAMKDQWKMGLVGSGVAAVVAAVLAPLWTSSLSHGIKTAVTLILVGFLVVLVVGYLVKWLVQAAKKPVSQSSGSSVGDVADW